MPTYFSVDVESTGRNPHDKTHQLISVGAVAVRHDGLIFDNWYERLRYKDSWEEETKEWWLQQNALAKDEVFSTLWRANPKKAAASFAEWVTEATWKAPDNTAIFVANPVSFDHAWVQRWLVEAGVDNPFHYRTMCLRSVDWGANPGPWGQPRSGHPSLIPHHALHDAQAQALDLIDFLHSQERRG